MEDKTIIIIILAPIIAFTWLCYQDKRQSQKLSDRLNNAENNITQLKNESR